MDHLGVQFVPQIGEIGVSLQLWIISKDFWKFCILKGTKKYMS